MTRLRTWECRCGAINLESHGECEACSRPQPEGAVAQQQAHRAPDLSRATPSGPPPCTFEQNQQAAAIVKAVLTGQLSAEEGQRRMDAVFGHVEAAP